MRKLRDFALETYFSRWEFSARYHMCASDIETLSLSELLDHADDEGRRRWDELRLGYIETFGTPELREAIAATYSSVQPDDVLVFAGAEEGIYIAMRTLLGRDDHAIVVTPNYQSAESLPDSICAVTGVALDPDAGWQLDLDRVRDAAQSNTKLIAVNFPHNPTGKILPRKDFDELIEFARGRGIYLFSDEVYWGIERDESLRLPQIADVYERGMSLNVLSKSYGLPGLRIGWIATRERRLLEPMERYKHYLSICNAAPSEMLATIALRSRDRILARNRALVDENLELLNAFFAEFSSLFEWTVPDGGCTAFPRYLGREGVETFCERLVENNGVLLLPASVYRSTLTPTPDDRFRIGFGRRGLQDGLNVMREALLARAA